MSSQPDPGRAAAIALPRVDSRLHAPRPDGLGAGMDGPGAGESVSVASDAGGAVACVAAALDADVSMSFVLGTAGSSGGRIGAKTSDTSDRAVLGDVARTDSGVSGKGIRIGILSDSFNRKGNAAADCALNNLPRNVRVLHEGRAGGHDEGRAMADLIHKIAPDAQIDFYSATGGENEFIDGIHALTAAGCKILVDDVAYLDEPFFQDGSKLDRAIEQAISHGVSYFTAASNQGTNYYEHGFTSMQVLLAGLPGIWTVNDFGTGGGHRPYVDLTIPNNTTCMLDLQWDEAFASISGGRGATSSLAMALYTASGKLVGTAGTLALGRDPRQLLEFINHTGTTHFRLVVLTNSNAPPPNQFKFIVYGSGTVNDPKAGIGSGTVAGHELVAGVNTVGAVAWSNTPRFGGTNTVEPFSSVGTGQILFDSLGHRLPNPISEQKVTFVAPDGSTTSVFAPFYGTSAAAPNAAAVAALVLQADPYLTPAQVTQVLEQSAITAYGSASSTGAGLIQATTAVQLAQAMLHHT